MTTNRTTKTITATTSEMPMVVNYIEHCIPPGERKDWKVNIVNTNNIEYRDAKKYDVFCTFWKYEHIY